MSSEDGLLDRLAHQLEAEEVFARERKSNRTRALGIFLHHAGLSCRWASKLVSMLEEPVSHTPISTWHRRATDLYRSADAKRHEELVVDETSLHIEQEDGELEEVYLWAAVNPRTSEVVHVAVTDGRSGIEALGFVRGVLHRCTRRPQFHVDEGVWYPWALTTLGLDWRVTSGGPRNKVETWFGVLKERLAAFRRRWPRNAAKLNVSEWARSYAMLWNERPDATC